MTKPTPSQIDEIKAVFSDRVGNTKQLMFNLLKIDDAITLAWQKAQQEFHTANCPLCTHEIMKARREAQSELLDELKLKFKGYGLTIGTSHFYNVLEELRKRKVSNG